MTEARSAWHRLGRALGLILHPVVPGFAVALLTSLRHEGGLTPRLIGVASLVLGLCVALPLLPLLLLYLTKKTDDLFAVRREVRIYLYPFAVLGLALSYAVFRWLYPFPLAATMVVAAAAVTAMMAIANQRLKVSIHCAGNAGVAVAAAWVYGAWGAALALVVPAVAWARITTKNHTPMETLVGSLVGAVGTGVCLVVLLP